MRVAPLCTVLAVVASPLAAQTLITVDKDASTATFVDLKSGAIVATLPTGPSPHELAISPDGKWAVATDYGAAGPGGTTLTVIDIAARKVVRTIDVSPEVRPHGAQFLPDNVTLAVTAERSGKVLLVDVAKGTVLGTRATGQRVGHMLVTARDGRTAYVANITSGSLSTVDLAGNTDPKTVAVGPQTESIALAPDQRTIWMGSNTTGKVFLVDVVAQRVVDSIQTSGMPYRVGFTPDGATAVVTNPERDEVRIVDVKTRSVRATLSVAQDGSPTQPQGIAMSPKGDKAWISLGRSAQIVEIDLHTNKVTRLFATGAGPDGIAFVP